MRRKEETVWTIAQQAVGRGISHIFRLLHLLDNRVLHPNEGPLLLIFDDNFSLFWDSDTDEETLSIKLFPWDDPFDGPLNDTDKEWVQTWGKEEYIEVSRIVPYCDLIGQTINAINPIFNPNNVLAGAQFLVDDKYLNFYIWGECLIVWGRTPSALTDNRFTIGS